MGFVLHRMAWIVVGVLLATRGEGEPLAAPPPTPTTVSAGEPAFEAIGPRQGLSSNAIFAVTVDRHGFIWFAGDNGLHRYDGQDTRSIDRDPARPDSLSSRTNTALAETRDALWIISFSGLLQRLDADSGAVDRFLLTRAHDGAQPGRGTNLVVDRQERLWIGTDIGLFRFDPATRTHASIRLYAEADARVTALALSEDGTRLYVASVDGRFAVLDPEHPEKIEPLLAPSSASQATVTLAVAEAAGQLWLATNQGLFRYDRATARIERDGIPPELSRWRLDALAVARDGSLWLGGAQHEGLTRYDPATGRTATYRHHPDDPHGLTSDRVAALAIDAHDNLWVGLISGGAHRLRVSQRGAVRYRGIDGQNNFCAMHELGDGHLAVSFCGGSIALLDPASGALEPRDGDLDRALAFPAPTLTSHALVGDGHDGVWLPTGNIGLLHWEPTLGRAVRYPLRSHTGAPLPDPYMNDALRDRAGRLWVACSLGLATIGEGEDALTLIDPRTELGKLISGGVLTVAQGADSALWIGSTHGLVRYNPQTHSARRHAYDPNDAQSLSDNLVVSVRFDRAGTLWVGTQAGLNRAQIAADGTLRFRRYGVGDGLPDQSIDVIVSDAEGTLWVGTNRGIARYDAERDRFRAYAPGDGVPDSGINWRSAAAARDGSIYFGSSAGLLRIFPERLSGADPQPVMLSSYEFAGNNRIHLRGAQVPSLTMSYDQARVRFLVAAFGDHRPLSHRMAGLEAQWRDMPANLSVGYDPLPPNDYRFEVRQLTRDGTWSSPLLSVPVHVAPPPWRTPVAYALYLALALSGLTLLARAYRRRRVQEKQHVDELDHLANFDALTGLPNRSRFGEALSAAMRDDSAPLALLFIDLDRFKNINDSLGHRFGDKVLVAAAHRLRAALPDNAQIARLGGDEFTVILPQLHHGREAATVAQALLEAFSNPLQVDASEVVVTLSIGISLFPTDTRDAALLIQYADSAMYHAKSSGRNAFRYFQPEMVAMVSRRLALETGLRAALDHDALYPVFQPQFDLRSGRVCGAEVLLRWNSPEHGQVAPAEFIPILEDTGLIEPVGLWLVDRVCAQMQAWREAGLTLPCVAINVSVHQLMRGELCDRLAERLSSLALPGHALELEVTESMLMENAQRMGAALSELRSLGLGLAIDDFGTGYSSFASLSHLPVSKLKIDKIFIDELGNSDRADTLCAAMIAMAHNLGLIAVAEGVETELQHRKLQAIGCDAAQGYYYARPLPLAEFERFVAQAAAREPASLLSQGP